MKMKLRIKHRLAITLLNLLSKTWKFELTGNEPKTLGIIAFWHGYMLPVWKYFSKYSPHAVVSQSKDGDILSGLLSAWNYNLIRGSSSMGSKEALSEITEKARNNLILITPDGPRGPLGEFKPGAVIAAQRSNTPLYLCRVEINRQFVFKKSWDKFRLPLLFAKINLYISEPILIPANAERDTIDDIITDCRNTLQTSNKKEEIK
jgi:lysophospholipid acyltransferase (LPLAT)-like uncharacterized protein